MKPIIIIFISIIVLMIISITCVIKLAGVAIDTVHEVSTNASHIIKTKGLKNITSDLKNTYWYGTNK